MGWSLILEYSLVVSTVAVGWSGYFVGFLKWVQNQTGWAVTLPATLAAGPHVEGGLINLPAVLVVIFATILLVRGARESSLTNVVMVLIKIAILIFFIIVAFTAFDSGNFEPLLPMGVSGVTGAAAVVFFSYIGFDAVSTAAQEARRPQRDMPVGILGSLVVCTLLYIAVAAVLTGLVPYPELGVADPIAKGVDAIALKIREIAQEHKVMVLESPGLARAVYYSTELDQEIPAGLYLAVAQVLAYVYQLRQYQAGKGKRPGPLPDLPIPPDLRRDA